MDWSKAKNILIFLFLALNIVLAMYLYLSFFNNTSTKNIINTEKILKSRGYILNTKIPKVSKAYALQYDMGSLDKTFIARQLLNKPILNINNKDLTQTLKYGKKSLSFESKCSFSFADAAPEKDVDISSREKVVKYSKSLINELKLPITTLYIDSYIVNQDKSISITFIGRYGKMLIFSNYVELKVSKKGLIIMKCNLAKLKGFAEGSEVNIFPAYQILLKYYVDGHNKVIENIDLGYWIKAGKAGANGSKTPEWRVRTGDGATEFFDNQGQRIT